MSHRYVWAIALAFGLITQPAIAASPIGGCKFDPSTKQFAGTVEQQASCLLKKVKPKGSGATPQPVPSWLLERIDKPIGLTKDQVQAYLDRNRIGSADLGGELAVGDAPARRYFVIHDTSWPELPDAPSFPAEIDHADHPSNRLTIWGSLSKKVNLIISRDGRSRTFQNWSAARPSSATKLEVQSNVSRDAFVHVENIQVRMKPAGSWAWRAPDPGFGSAQEGRLALAYVVASLRAGRWLIPAYHFNIDQGIKDAHDDPQNVDLASWIAKVQSVEREISEREP
jgi:hypothetical protein